ncbi:MAG: UDP-N-acetylglucosamine--LPS N-acetylglucosamine transferase [Candidatus Omnitrophica bacterium]|nr:UDP-N-acetylglucosamine--LPS N-acetylglucosamine transferase [Candidatus Omnitrophota bacterium]
MSDTNKKVVAVSSGGGHWVQLLRLRPAFEGCRVVYVTVNEGYRSDVMGSPFRVITDATRWEKFHLVWCAFQILLILLRERPDVILSTGAAPGYLAIRLGRLLGARSIWVDSIANVEELSLSGKRVGQFTDLWLTQWKHLEKPEGPNYEGSVL